MSPKIVIYTTEYCPYCVRAKSYFKQNGLAFEEIDLTNKPKEIEEIKNKTGHRTVPLIFINDAFIGGYSDLMSKIEAGVLKL